MRKTNFLSSLGTKLALAAIVLVSSMFTSCEKEDFDATFEPGDAIVTLNVKVTDMNDGDVTNEATITVTGALTKIGETPFPDGFKGGEVNINAAYKGGEENTTITLPELKAGGKANYNVSIIISRGDIKIEKVSTEDDVIKSELLDYTHTSADGKTWWENASEYILLSSINYTLYNEQTATTDVNNDVVTTFINALTFNNTEETSLEIKASAWSLYRAWMTVHTSTTVYKVTRGTEELGTITVDAKYGTAAQYEETAHPNHAGDYHNGHGHGSTSNAGGGIVIPE